MEEIKVGDYCKDIYGRIGKIKSYSNGTYFTGKFGANSGEIVIHSPNIIDLIQEGDYVNGEKVSGIFNPMFLSWGELPYVIAGIGNHYEPQDIKTIVTKQQMEAIQYVIK